MCLIHRYESIVTQTHYHYNIMRNVNICKKCGKLKYTMLNPLKMKKIINILLFAIFELGTNKYYIHEHDWQPEMDITQYKRDIKLNKLLK